ncbi:MAG TPA: pyridoxamine 5'-phosphate oxidase family protein [Methanospirillum sp.]|nr:pyridoxamine 5'-phosphate oxidase family protein [Methanospirillum sp.]
MSGHNHGLNLMSEAKTAVLTTIDEDGWPSTRAMLNLRNVETYPDLAPVFDSHRGDLLIYFTTNTSSGKISQIGNNGKASVYYCDPLTWRGLMLGGTISIVSDPALNEKIWQKDWTMYYPGGVHDTDYSILCLVPRVAKYYECLDSVSWSLTESQ